MAFAVIWWREPLAASAGWAAGGYALSSLTTIIDLARGEFAVPVAVVCVPMQWAALAMLTQAFLVRRDRTLPWRALALMWAGAVVVHCHAFLVVPDHALRNQLSNVFTAGIVLTGAVQLVGLPRLGGIERLATGTLCLGAALYGWRGLSAIIWPVSLANSTAWVGDTTMLALYLGNMLAGLAIALVLFIAIGMDLINRHHRETRTDPLTGVGNRRALDDAIGADHLGTARYDAALMVDLDHFKRVNDSQGHAAGDAVLAAVGQTLQRQLGDLAVVLRVGGEEFSVLVPRGNGPLAASLALVTRAAIAKLSELVDPLTLSASIGLAQRRDGESLREMLRRADMALYRAKAEGRDRVIAAPEAIVFAEAEAAAPTVRAS